MLTVTVRSASGVILLQRPKESGLEREVRHQEYTVTLFLFGFLALNYPLVSLFSGGMVFGLPLLFVYLFTVWLLVIVLAAVALGVAGSADPDPHGIEPDPAD